MSPTESKTDVTPEAAAAQLVFQLGTGYILSTALQIAVWLDIADKLAAGPRTAAELAKDAGVRADPLYRVLRALASVGLFQEVEPQRFAMTPAAELLRSGTPGSLRNLMLWLSDPLHFRVYADAMHSLQTGQPAIEKTTGLPVFEFFPKHPAISEVFNNAMTEFSGLVIPAVLEAYDFSGIDVLVDVAGGHGAVLSAILGKYPAMRGILFDLAHVIEGAAPRIQALGLAGRCETRTGDFFKEVPSGDAYVMKHIIHDWDDDRAVVILKNIHKALAGKPHGRVILIEAVLQPGNAPDLGKLIDLEMLTFPGGRERTAKEFTSLFANAGFTQTRFVATHSPLSVIDARP